MGGAMAEAAAFQGLNLNYDHEMIRVAPEFLAEFAKAVDTPEAEPDAVRKTLQINTLGPWVLIRNISRKEALSATDIPQFARVCQV